LVMPVATRAGPPLELASFQGSFATGLYACHSAARSGLCRGTRRLGWLFPGEPSAGPDRGWPSHCRVEGHPRASAVISPQCPAFAAAVTVCLAGELRRLPFRLDLRTSLALAAVSALLVDCADQRELSPTHPFLPIELLARPLYPLMCASGRCVRPCLFALIFFLPVRCNRHGADARRCGSTSAAVTLGIVAGSTLPGRIVQPSGGLRKCLRGDCPTRAARSADVGVAPPAT